MRDDGQSADYEPGGWSRARILRQIIRRGRRAVRMVEAAEAQHLGGAPAAEREVDVRALAIRHYLRGHSGEALLCRACHYGHPSECEDDRCGNA